MIAGEQEVACRLHALTIFMKLQQLSYFHMKQREKDDFHNLGEEV